MSENCINGFRLDDIRTAVERVGPAWDGLQDANIFITGATGFLGQWLLAVLMEADKALGLDLKITALTRSPRNFELKCPELASFPTLTLLHGDVRTFEFPKGKFTHLIHAATDTSVEADNNPLGLLDGIVEGTKRILKFAHMAGIKKVLFTSSGAIYGPQPADLESIPETYQGACPTTDRRSVYGQGKRLAEQLMSLYYHEFGIKTKIARCFAFLGPGMAMNAHFAIGNFIRDAVEGDAIIIKGDGQPIRSYLYAADAAAWLIRLLEEGAAGEVYNVGSDDAHTLADLAEQVMAQVNPKAVVDIQGKPKSEGFRSRYIPNIEKARKLGLDVWTGLSLAIARTAEWHEDVQKKGPLATATELGAQEGHAEGDRQYTFVVDIDGVIASLTLNNDYSLATPLQNTIKVVNSLYDQGHKIILFTARGDATGIDWSKVTAGQMSEWGVKYHELRFGKPAGDYYIDDRLISVGELEVLLAGA